MAAADLDGDGKTDLLITASDGDMFPMLGNGDGTFKASPKTRNHGKARRTSSATAKTICGRSWSNKTGDDDRPRDNERFLG
jgi:hypothetical protein